ncbi:MAG: cardiolipin synthase [Clostridia bacterium]|nr:cardiolipin synthase [Clostridia bacterium]
MSAGQADFAAEERGADGMSALLERLGYPTYDDGDVSYYPTGKELFAAMLDALRRAEKFVLMEYFILAGGTMWRELLKLLLEKAEEGVQIKIIYDDFGSMFSLPPHYARYLEGLHENIRCLAFNKVYPIFSPSYNHRDHRKILIVDGKVGFTGGMNIADEYIDEKKRFGYWKDTGIRVRGEGVRSMTKAFLETWVALKEPQLDVSTYLQSPAYGKTGACIIPCADSPLDEVRTCEAVYLEMIHRAKEYLYITTPYLVLDEALRAALCLAAMRGVDVRILTPGIPDKKTVYRLTRANYGVLLRSGVRIYEYTPGFLHAKMTLSDGAAVVGTTNYDYRSLYLHFENMVYFRDESCIAAIREDFEQMFLVSKERTEADTKRRFLGKAFDTVLRIFEPLL